VFNVSDTSSGNELNHNIHEPVRFVRLVPQIPNVLVAKVGQNRFEIFNMTRNLTEDDARDGDPENPYRAIPKTAFEDGTGTRVYAEAYEVIRQVAGADGQGGARLTSITKDVVTEKIGAAVDIDFYEGNAFRILFAVGTTAEMWLVDTTNFGRETSIERASLFAAYIGGHAMPITSVAISADYSAPGDPSTGVYVVTGSADSTSKLWYLTGSVRTALFGQFHKGRTIIANGFVANGEEFVTVDNKGIAFWGFSAKERASAATDLSQASCRFLADMTDTANMDPESLAAQNSLQLVSKVVPAMVKKDRVDCYIEDS
jgi:hypothetical protein